MNYLPYIDGLRAVAILLVLFFHAGIKFFPSGFIGVDIFFVISGFLITGIISSSLENNKFSFTHFYTRRLWRLQPVFICLLIVSTLIAFIYCVPDDLIQYSKSLRKSALYISNNFFGRVTTGYFAPDSKQLPLLHTWSLSIEWQCYLILPLLLFLLHRYFKKEQLVKIIYLLTGLSLAAALYSSLYNPLYTYYLLSSRIFEFLIGACVFFNGTNYSFNKYFLNLVGVLALGSILYISTLDGVALAFPNGYGLIACMATALLILTSNNNPSLLVPRFLSIKILVFIGLISYSLYIWHWPIFAFSRYLGITERFSILAGIFTCTFIIAYCSWRFIEKPARNFKSLSFINTLAILIIIPLLIVHLVAYEIKKQEGFPRRFSKKTPVFTVLKKYQNNQREACLVFKNTELSKECMIGDKNKNSKTALMIGDSFSNHYWNFIDQLALRAKVSVIAQAMGSCLTLPDLIQKDFLSPKGTYKICQQQTKNYYELIKKNHYDYVILGASWNGYKDQLVTEKEQVLSSEQAENQIQQSLDKALHLIIQAGSKPVLIKAIPISNKGNPYHCFLKHIKQGYAYNAEECDYEIISTQQKWVNTLYTQMKKKYPELIVLEPQSILCTKNSCRAELNNIPVFRDASHITDYASYYIGKNYLEQYKNPFLG